MKKRLSLTYVLLFIPLIFPTFFYAMQSTTEKQEKQNSHALFSTQEVINVIQYYYPPKIGVVLTKEDKNNKTKIKNFLKFGTTSSLPDTTTEPLSLLKKFYTKYKICCTENPFNSDKFLKRVAKALFI